MLKPSSMNTLFKQIGFNTKTRINGTLFPIKLVSEAKGSGNTCLIILTDNQRIHPGLSGPLGLEADPFCLALIRETQREEFKLSAYSNI